MASRSSLFLLLVLFTSLIGFLQARQFNVGGKEGWVPNPSENFNRWAERMRFEVNDTLFFKYIKGSDSVLVVAKEDYYKCNTESPIEKMDGGDSLFKFNQSGPFYFISGNKTYCEKGQKLITVVLALRNHEPAPAGAPVQAPKVSRAPAQAPATGHMSPSPSPLSPPGAGNAPAPAPGGAPAEVIFPPRLGSYAPVFTQSVVVASSVTLVLSLCLGSFF